jgi:hypothetical protein
MPKTAAVLILLVAAVGALAQSPQIQNGQVDSRAVTSLARDVAELTAQATTPTWVAWQVPMIDGERNLCCTYYSDGMLNPVRGCRMEPGDPYAPSTPPDFPPPSGPVQLEAGTTLTVYMRLVDTRIERLRVLSDDCPVDAGGRQVRWLTGVTGADSVAFLSALATNERLDVDVRSSLARAAVRGIALHRDPSAVATLIDMARTKPASPQVTDTRREAMQGLGQSRDPRALQFLTGIITR